MTAYDVLVVGAGILGLSTAYHIKREKPSLKVLIVDKNIAAGLGSTVNSAAAFRCFFSSSSNYALADSSVEFYRHVQDELGVDLKMRWCGYLWCFTEEEYNQVQPVLKALAARGFTYKEYNPDVLADAIGMKITFSGHKKGPQVGNVFKAAFVPKAGLIGVISLVRYYETEFLKLGGEIRYRTQATKLLVEANEHLSLPGELLFWQEATVVGVETDIGIINAKKVVLATGAWLPQLLDSVGVECFVKARKRQVFNVRAETEPMKKLLHTQEFTEAGLPLLVLAKPHVYVRPNLEGEGFGFGYADDFPRPFKIEEHPKPEAEFFEYGLLPVATSYLPQLEGAISSGGFAGLYEINTIDEQPLIFEKYGVIVVGGASGSGIMKADAIGRIAQAVYAGNEQANLYGGLQFKVSDLGLKNRRVEPEKLVI